MSRFVDDIMARIRGGALLLGQPGAALDLALCERSWGWPS